MEVDHSFVTTLQKRQAMISGNPFHLMQSLAMCLFGDLLEQTVALTAVYLLTGQHTFFPRGLGTRERGRTWSISPTLGRSLQLLAVGRSGSAILIFRSTRYPGTDWRRDKYREIL